MCSVPDFYGAIHIRVIRRRFPSGDRDQGSNDLVWAIRSEEDQHHWDEGRIVGRSQLLV